MMNDTLRAIRLISSLAALLTPEQIRKIIGELIAESALQTERELFEADLLDAMALIGYLLEIQADIPMPTKD